MRWSYLYADQDTHHCFLNLYTLHYEVTKEDGSKAPYDYYVASRNSLETLKAKKPDFSRPDGVIMALYYVDPETKEVSILINTQFRPASPCFTFWRDAHERNEKRRPDGRQSL